MEAFRRQSKKTLIGIVGGLVFLAGLVMIPYPGPGWLVVFAGLAILATEFRFAARILDYARARYDRWALWLRRQHWAVRVVFFLITSAVVVVTVWLLNGFGIMWAIGEPIFELEGNWSWLSSPLFS